MINELNKLIANKVIEKEDSTGKPLGSKLTYEEVDNSFEYGDETIDLSDKNTDTHPKSNLEFEEAEESVCFNPVVEKEVGKKKPMKGKSIKMNSGDISTDVSPIDSEEISIPSPGDFMKASQMTVLGKKEFLRSSGKLKLGSMIKPKEIAKSKKL